jgi:tripartite-type tricarboxylate transporter receptor subunit TctC
MKTAGRSGAALAVVASIALCGCGAWAQALNSMKVIVTFPFKSGGDILTRAVTTQSDRLHGTATSVDNQSAAVGTKAVVEAAPDGNTLIVINNNFVADSNFRKLTYDPLVDLTPICSLATAQTLIVVSSSSPYQTLGDLISAARQGPPPVRSLTPVTLGARLIWEWRRSSGLRTSI